MFGGLGYNAEAPNEYSPIVATVHPLEIEVGAISVFYTFGRV